MGTYSGTSAVSDMFWRSDGVPTIFPAFHEIGHVAWAVRISGDGGQELVGTWPPRKAPRIMDCVTRAGIDLKIDCSPSRD